MHATEPSKSHANGENVGPPAAATVPVELEHLTMLSPNELRGEWRRLFRSEPPRLSPDLMARAIAYRIQEIAYGGLSKSAERQLVSVAMAQHGPDAMPVLKPRVRPGTRFVREWRGRTHVVTVREDGFEYRGQPYRSLSRIALEITGAHWSGPRFFGSTETGRSVSRGTTSQKQETGDG